jgi:surface polysaccharide O-acyltransferase-like enzyme
MERVPMGTLRNGFAVEFIRQLISQGISNLSVPLYFAVAGYLFFLGDWSQQIYLGKLKRRLNTLLIPFLFWNIVAVALVLCITQAKSYLSHGGAAAAHFSLLDYLAFAGITAKYPISYQFWFIRDLMVLGLLTPVFHFLLARKSALPFLGVLFGLWFVSMWPLLWPRVDAVFFFVLGAYLSRRRSSLAAVDRFGPAIGVLFLACLIVNSACPECLPYLSKFSIILGVPSLWWLTGIVRETVKLKSALLNVSADSFFVFAAHEPLLTSLCAHLHARFSQASALSALALYLFVPICLIAFLVCVHRLLLKTTPSFTGLITGSVGSVYR